ncbi:restriction endonuclease subunit S, partial [Ferroacidibacillus organovorans]|uniref:restriction endonuclease subunit S n=1 Tax=Ferroacidibacillus organovorans TaxID=1765683 RepID=UPI0013659B97
MAKIGSVVRLRKEKVDPKITPFSALHLITIHFDGSVSERKIESSRQYTMDMYWARPRDIVVAKIDLKNGAVSVIPDDWCNVAVTNHFAVYEPDEKLIFPEYLRLIVQVSFFKAYLNRNKVGAEGRKEVKLDFFESIKIPLPPLDVQRAIVQKWGDAQAEIESRIRDIEMLQKSVSSIIQNTLRNNGDEKNVRPKYFAMSYAVVPNNWVLVGSNHLISSFVGQ